MRRGKKEGIMAYNDYELIYLARIGDDEVLDIIIRKYEPLVHKMISNFNISNLNKEDYLQEGRFIINKAVNTFNDNSKMTFTKYVEMLLYHRFIDLIRVQNRNKYELMETDKIEYIYDTNNKEQKIEEQIIINYDELSDFEKTIYEYKFIKKYSSKYISKLLNIPIKRIYSATERILKKRDNN